MIVTHHVNCDAVSIEYLGVSGATSRSLLTLLIFLLDPPGECFWRNQIALFPYSMVESKYWIIEEGDFYDDCF